MVIKNYISYFKHICGFPNNLSYDLASEIINEDNILNKNVLNILEGQFNSEYLFKLKAILNKRPFKPTCFLFELGFSPLNINNILNYIEGYSLNQKLKENPYILTEIPDISFNKIDRIALTVFNIAPDNAIRLKYLILNSVAEFCYKKGHTYAEEKDILASVKGIAGVKDHLNKLVEEKLLIREDNRIYTKNLYQAECGVASIMKNLIKKNEPTCFFKNLEIQDFINKYENIQTQNINNGSWQKLKWADSVFKLSEEQRDAFSKFVNNRVLLLTGFPGSGKTSLIKCFVDVCVNKGLKVELLSPTGIAAKKMSLTCNYEANTIHKILKYDGKTWNRSSSNPLGSDIYIIDEFSMVDLELLFRFLQALDSNKDCILVFVGDPAQLPSVAPGNLIKEFQKVKELPKVNLVKIYRQEETSDIILNARIIAEGKGDLVQKRGDFLFFESDKEETILEDICKIVTKLKDKQFKVLSPTYKGTVGVTNLNKKIQELLNPDFRTHCVKVGEVSYGFNDKIMIIKNDYKNEVYNGESGVIKEINFSANKINILINERVISYFINDISQFIALDYARTVHKVQGMEYDYIVMPLVNRFGIQLQRNLLYTAVTRAKNKIIMLGNSSALEKSIRNNQDFVRNTFIRERIEGVL